jgi:uncharacterized NAD-dependent epimerase/dehydratase family protein
MQKLPAHRRMLLLTEGRLGVLTSKTAAVLLRYRPDDIAAVIDARAAGGDIRDSVAWAPPVPILPDIAAAAPHQPDALVIGITPEGGALPDDMRRHVEDALSAGLDVISGLHTFLGDDPALRRHADDHRARIYDLRRPPTERVIAAARARQTRCRRILTVGSDCSVGKMVAATELARAGERRGLDARLLATGQTAIMVAGAGITVDSCVADFAAGAIEQLVLDAADADICFIEGQGSIAHPGYSPVMLALLHGACPDAMILVHHLGRTHYKAPPHDPLPELQQLIPLYEQVAGLLHPARVVGVALNTHGQPEQQVRAATAALEQEFGIPVEDPYRDGCERLLDAALADGTRA